MTIKVLSQTANPVVQRLWSRACKERKTGRSKANTNRVSQNVIGFPSSSEWGAKGSRLNGQDDVVLFRNKVRTLDRFRLFTRRGTGQQPGTICADGREKKMVRFDSDW